MTLTMWYSFVLKEQHFQFMMLDNMNHLFMHKLELMSARVLQQEGEKLICTIVWKSCFFFFYLCLRLLYICRTSSYQTLKIGKSSILLHRGVLLTFIFTSCIVSDLITIFLIFFFYMCDKQYSVRGSVVHFVQ